MITPGTPSFRAPAVRPFPKLRTSATWIVCTLLLISTSAAAAWEPTPFQDGSVVVSPQPEGLSFSFPYAPFLGSYPWVPNYPREFRQPVEPVPPLQGLAGNLQLGFMDPTGAFKSLTESDLVSQGRTPYSAAFQVETGAQTGVLSWNSPMDHPGSVFEFRNSTQALQSFALNLVGQVSDRVWATPRKKMKHNWGLPHWEWRENERLLVQSYTLPLSVTDSVTTGLWIGETGDAWKNFPIRYSSESPGLHRIVVEIPAGESIRFGFLHSDNPTLLAAAADKVRKERVDLARLASDWTGWAQGLIGGAAQKFKFDPKDLSPFEQKLLSDNLIQARLLMASNGAILSEPILPDRMDFSLRDQGVAMHHWRQMGLEFPDYERTRDLARFNPMSQRAISVSKFSRGGLHDVLRQGKIVITSPDPDAPPSKEEMDSLLGYVIGGGNLTLVDGYSGFQGKSDWWTEAGAADPADYAIRMLMRGVDFDSRQILDAESLSETQNTYAQGGDRIASSTTVTTATPAFTTAQPGGFLLIHSTDELSPEPLRIHRVRFGGQDVVPYTAGEHDWLAAEFGRRQAVDGLGRIVGCDLLDESFLLYRLPSHATSQIEIEASGNWVAWRMENIPSLTQSFVKKAFHPIWFKDNLLRVDLHRAAHPVVYSGTFTVRVFDATGTESSPVLSETAGKGRLVWIGLPWDYLVYGSDTGTDYQNSLRSDPGYDLLRMTLVLHDPRTAGGERASRTPLIGWGDDWSQSPSGQPDPVCSAFAIRPFGRIGTGGGSLGSWFIEGFQNALLLPSQTGDYVPGLGLMATTNPGASRSIRFSENVFTHVFARDLARVSGWLGRTWLSDFSQSYMNSIATYLPQVLPVTGEQPILSRRLVDGVPGEPEPTDSELYPAALTLAELSVAEFPGGATAHTALLNWTAAQPAIQSDPRSAALLATQSAELRATFVESLPNRAGKGDLAFLGREGKPFDWQVAIPALHALCLKKAGPPGS